MKIIRIIALTILAFVVNTIKADVMIKGHIVSEETPSVEITCMESSPFAAFTEPVEVDAHNNFETTIKAAVAFWIRIMIKICEEITTFSFIAEPGESYSVNFSQKPLPDGSFFEVKGKNEEGIKYMASLDDISFPELSARPYLKEKNLTAIDEKIKKNQNDELTHLKGMLENKKISSSFFRLAKLDRICYYNVIASAVAQGFFFNSAEENQDFPPEYKAYWLKSIREIRANKEFRKTRDWDSFMQLYCNYLMVEDNKPREELRSNFNNGTYHTYCLGLMKKNATNDEYELYAPEFIYTQAIQAEFEEELLHIYDSYKREFPKSPYSKFLEPEIQKIQDYHQFKNRENSKINIVEGYDTISDLKSCLAMFKGKKLLVDVGATWCGPCKREYKYKDNLNKILKKNGYEILYISIDEEQSDEKWREMIKYYNLEGYHVRTNPKFHKDLFRVFGSDTLLIPWYFIVNEDGEIVRRRAAKPSQLSTLEGQLE